MSAVYGFHLDELVPFPMVKRGRICDIGDLPWSDAYKGIQHYVDFTDVRCIGLDIDKGDTNTPFRRTRLRKKGRPDGQLLHVRECRYSREPDECATEQSWRQAFTLGGRGNRTFVE